jgi:acetyl-CoA C-acetyltransferase
MSVIELHDAFAVQGLSFCKALGIDPARINRLGGGLARGHPIGASGAVALVRLLSDLQRDEKAGARGLVAVAGAGGIGAAAIVERL